MKIGLLLSVLVPMVLSFFCFCGGGADVGNPFVGVVSLNASKGAPIAGARIVLAFRGTDPGIPGAQKLVPDSMSAETGLLLVFKSAFFDTAYTDAMGQFSFENVISGEYVVHATYQNFQAIKTVSISASDDEKVELVLTDPAAIRILMYDAVDTSTTVHFTGARVTGTELYSSVNAEGEISMPAVPQGDLDLVLYRSDTTKVYYTSLRTFSGTTTELYSLPSIDTAFWTARNSSIRSGTEKPYILTTYMPLVDNQGASLLDTGKQFDIRVQFSDDMDVLKTTAAIKPFADGDSVAINAIWWVGGTVAYVDLCVPDTAGVCNNDADSKFKKGITYGITITTAAQSVHGVALGYQKRITFIPVP